MIAKISETEGVCLDGRWKGWLFRRGPDGQWISVRELSVVDPMQGNPLAALFAARADDREELELKYGLREEDLP